MSEWVMALDYQAEKRLWNMKREEVVRCSDCIYHEVIGMDGSKQSVCSRYIGASFALSSDGFCAWGERRDA